MVRMSGKFITFYIIITVVLLVSSTTVYAIGTRNEIVVFAKDSLNNNALVSVLVRGLAKDTIVRKRTDYKGTARIPKRKYENIEVSSVGYFTKVQQYSNSDTILIFLAPKYGIVDEVVVTGNFTPMTQKESVTLVKIIDRLDIEAMQANTVKDVLQWENTVRIAQDNILGSSMSMQGISGQNIKVLIDGIPVIGRLNGNIDLNQVLLSDVERIEIIRGPMSVQYGTDALGGVINLITKTTTEKTEQDFLTTANMYVESVGTYNFDGEIQKEIEGIDTRFSIGRYFFSGFNSELFTTSRAMQWKPREQYFFDAQLQRKIGGNTIRYDGRYFNELILNRGEPVVPYRERAFDETYRTQRFSHSLIGDVFIDTSSQLSVTANYSVYERKKNRYLKNLQTLENSLTSEASDQDTSGFITWMARAVYTNIASDQQRQIGFDMTLDNTTGKRILANIQSIQDFGVFGTYTWKMYDRISVQPGLRWAYNSRYVAPFIPSMNIKYDISSLTNMRIVYSRGFRAPSLRELGFYFVDVNHNIQGNPQLSAEKSHNVQCSLSHDILSSNNHTSFTVSGFYNDIENIITLAQVSDALYSYVNLEKHRTHGGIFSCEGVYSDVQISVSYSVTGLFNAVSEMYDIQQYFYTHDLQSSIRFNNLFSLFTPSINVKYNGRQQNVRLDNNKLVIGYIENYTLIDMMCSVKNVWKNINISLGVKNILNVTNINANTQTNGTHSSSAVIQPIALGRLFTFDTSFTINW